MKDLRRKIILCLLPVVIGLLIIGVAWYNYSNPPLKIAGVTMSRLKFKLGVDLVGGTILVYEIDPDKKPESYSKDQLIGALKRRLDPADLYNITIRPLSETRVEIILPTGGRQLLEAQKTAWGELLDEVAKKWDKVKRDELTARVGDRAELALQIRKADPDVSGEVIDTFIKEKWDDVNERSLTGDDVERIKDLIQRVGSLEFRTLANRNDDKEALDAAKAYFDKAAASWATFVKAVETRFPETAAKKDDKDDLKVGDIAAGDRAEVAVLIKRRYPTMDPREIDRWIATNFNPSPELRDLMNRADSGQPPQPPVGAEGRKFRFTNNSGEHRGSYSWVELGKNELHSLHLNNNAVEDMIQRLMDETNVSREKAEASAEVQRTRAMVRAVAEARAKGVMIDTFPVNTEEGGVRQDTIYGKGEFRVPLFSRRVTNPSRLAAKDRDKRYEYFFLTRDAEPGKEITGEFLTSAKEGSDRTGGMSVDFRFNAKGENLFYDLTTANSPPPNDRDSRRFLAIVLDGQIMSAPGVETAIRGSGQIHGKFTKTEISSLVNILRSGALPATLKPQPVSENTMGATLGDDTITSGTTAIFISFLAVMVFMVIYYRFAGLVACIALIANLILTVAFMVAVNATFTLPGLAGLVLTLGMAVDANVLIYERIREERERGGTLAMAIRNGYDRALPTIIDTHLTSIFTAIVLYVVGNDQLKGFGISLTVGLLISLFTALYMTRVIFSYWEAKGLLGELSMVKLFSKPNIHFMGIRKQVFTATVCFALFGFMLFVARGKSSLNMDFVGGTVYTGELTSMKSIDELRKLLEDEKRQKERLALDSDPEPVAGKERTWKLTYKEGQDSERVREIRVTENATASELKQRAEALPEVSLELLFTGSADLSKGNESKLFTVRTTEKSPDLVAASVSRLLGEDLKTTRLDGYTVQQLRLTFPKEQTIEQAKALLSKPLNDAKIPTGDALILKGIEDGAEKGTFKVMILELATKEPVSGAKLIDALLPLTEEDAKKNKKRQVELQVVGAKLDLSDYSYVSQVKTLLDSQLKGLITQEVNLTESDRKDERDGRFNQMNLSLPSPVDARNFREAMTTFGTELAARPLPVRLENFDSALAADMQQRALYAILASWGAILLYLWFRFGNWTFGLAAVLCLIHDVCFTLGLIAICHYLHGTFIGDLLALRDFKIDLPAVASLLTLIGFSVNDTIVVFDRIREVRGKNPNLTPEMINESINQTLSRTILTSLTVFLVVLVLFIWGGEGVHLFAFVMVIGVLVGTYSSIFVASPLLLLLGEGSSSREAMLAQRQREEKPVGSEG